MWVLILAGSEKTGSLLTGAVSDIYRLQTADCSFHLRYDLRTPLQCKVFLSGLTTIQAAEWRTGTH